MKVFRNTPLGVCVGVARASPAESVVVMTMHTTLLLVCVHLFYDKTVINLGFWEQLLLSAGICYEHAVALVHKLYGSCCFFYAVTVTT